MGHKKADCLRLLGGATREPSPSTLRITNGHEGKTEAFVVRIRAFSVDGQVARVAPDVVTTVYHYHVFFCFHYLFLCFI